MPETIIDDPRLLEMTNALRLSPSLLTAGHPSEDDLRAAAGAGVLAVVNLSLHGQEYSLPDEEGLCARLGMSYTHIPVIWTAPEPRDFERFTNAMLRLQETLKLAHCVKNYRVSAFMCLHRVLRQGMDIRRAMADVYAVWEPNDVWRTFMESQLGRPLPSAQECLFGEKQT